MAPGTRRSVSGTAFLLLMLPAPSALGQTAPEYEVYAVEYASLPGLALSRFLPGADPSQRVDVSLMFWVLKAPDGRAILVDAGYRPDAPNGGNPAVQGYLRPDRALAELGIRPEELSDIVLTHMHWDHVDGVLLFPNATIWVQREELEYYSTMAWQEGGITAGIDPRNVMEIVSLNTEGRVILIEGDGQEIFEGVWAYTGPRHSHASQYLSVTTAGGRVILASDCVPLFRNLELGVANTTTLDPEADLAAFERMRGLASRPEWIIPGHDREVFRRFGNPGSRIARVR